jgi:glycosyltransferase involved in cell wall biosynthesis
MPLSTENPDVSIVIPLHNEEAVLPLLEKRLTALLESVHFNIEFVLVDDGSKDKTASMMTDLAYKNDHFHCIFLSRNYGHQLAVSAGLSRARGKKAVMIMDGDLQDPPELITEFLKKIEDGYDVVYAIRKNRKESLLKKLLYKTYYRIQRSVSDFEIPIDSGDFSMLSRRAVDELNNMPEQNRYLRGMRSWIGFRQYGYAYDRDARSAGTTSYSFRKLMALAYNGIFNFSEFPVKVIFNLGIVSIVVSLLYLAFTIIKRFFLGGVPAGFTALLFGIILFSGVQLISLGLIGEYVLRIYDEVRKRPLYIIDKSIIDSKQVNG